MECTEYTIEIRESPVGITFGHDLQERILIVAKVNPARIAFRLGVEAKDTVLDINGQQVVNSKESLEYFRKLSRGNAWPIRVTFLRERLIDLSAVLADHEAKRKAQAKRKREAQIVLDTPPLLFAEVSFGGNWFPAKVQKLNPEFYLVTFIFSDIAREYDLVGTSATLPSDRVRLSTYSRWQSKFNDMGESAVTGFEKMQHGLTEDPMSYMKDIGSAGVGWASSKIGSWWSGGSDLDPDPAPSPSSTSRTSPDQSIYHAPDRQAAYPVYTKKPEGKDEITIINHFDEDATNLAGEVNEAGSIYSNFPVLPRHDSKGIDEQKMLEQFMEESAKLRATLQAELDKELGDL